MGATSFRRSARLLKPTEFKRVFEQPVVSADGYFRVFARAGEGPRSRLGMGVSRKVDSRASTRNRIRRVIRESFRLNHPFDEARISEARSLARDYVVLASARAAGEKNAKLSESLSRHWDIIDRKLAAEVAPSKDIE